MGSDSPDTTLSIPAVEWSRSDGSAPLEGLEGPAEAHREPTPGLRLHQIARVDLEGAWVAWGDDPHEREHLSCRAPEAKDALAVDRAVRAQISLGVDARNRQDAGNPLPLTSHVPIGVVTGCVD